MKIEHIEIHNYRVFKDAVVDDIPNYAVFIGKNGVGKTTFFDIFGFLHDCLINNVRYALDMRGGFDEVVSRDQKGHIGFTIKFRLEAREPLITYELQIGLSERGHPVVHLERLRFRRGSRGAPWLVLDFSNGKGRAVAGEIKSYEDAKKIENRTEQELNSPDILAIKGLGQFKEFIAVASLCKMIEDWHVFDFHIDETRQRKPNAAHTSLSTTGDNLVQVTKYLRDQYPDDFQNILNRMKERIPSVSSVRAEETTDHHIVLQFQNEHFKNPFLSRFVSDGTMKMFTYLVLLNNPERHALLCIEEPENQLYPDLLSILAEEFRRYSQTGGQVFVSTHSPDFLNAIELDELYCIFVQNGYSVIRKISKSDLVKKLWKGGDPLGDLWIQKILMEEAQKIT
ncbi:MAG: AAA family ATPase [Planctomycetia bacterium]|nr:AAA family ATPase [Planctomycetia bacterium]